MKIIEQLIDQIDTYLEATGLTARQFGVRVTNDHGLYYRVMEGRITLVMYERICAFMRDNPPQQNSSNQTVPDQERGTA